MPGSSPTPERTHFRRAGAPGKVGVLLLENTHLRVPGAMADLASYKQPTIFARVPGAVGLDVVHRPDGKLARAYARAGRQLVARGATLLASNCGFAISFQETVRCRTGAPTALSGLSLLPLVRNVHGPRVAVLTFDARALDVERLAAAGWTGAPPLMADVQSSPHWRALSAEGTVTLNLPRMGRDLAEVVRRLIRRRRVDAIVIECTGMLPFTQMLRESTRLPVYDIYGLIELIAAAQ